MAVVSAVEAPLQIANAIRKGSDATGTDFDYLLATAARESAFKPNAKARTSSATGLFQFIESTWIQTVKEEGARYGLGKYEPHIFKTSSGRYTVPNKAIRNEILNLRKDPEIAATMAGAFTKQNAEYVGSRLGREPTQGELYIAHFLGPGGATKLITLASKAPNARADSHFPRAANANKGIFYSSGRARSVSQVYDLLVSDHSKLTAMTSAANMPKTEMAQVANTGLVGEGGVGWDDYVDGADDVPEAERSLLPRYQAEPLLDRTPVEPLVKKTKVAALAPNPTIGLHEAQIINDAGLGSIGPWQTTVVRDAAAKADPPATAALSNVAKDKPVARDGRPDTAVIRSRLHGGEAAQSQSVAKAARQTASRAIKFDLAPVRDFADKIWSEQALYGS